VLYETVDAKRRFKVEAPVDEATWEAVRALCREWHCTPADVTRKAVRALVDARRGPVRGVVDR
jgi:hypothetical protein